MPERDFELYLSLLSRFLRLKPAQHAEIADELRDHLEQRLEELTTRGLSHDDAIRRALDELGDAAELAHHFTRATRIRRRRLIMRCTLGTIGTLAASLLVALAFWPATPQSGIAVNAIAENPPAAAPLEPRLGANVLPPGEKWGFLRPDRASAKILMSLGNSTEVNFEEVPLVEAVHYLKDFHQINIWIDRPVLNDVGISLDSPITLQLNGVTLASTLKLMLVPLGLTYVIEDEVLKVTTPPMATNVIAVYNIRHTVGPQAVQLGLVDGAARLQLPGLHIPGLRMSSSPRDDEDDRPNTGIAGIAGLSPSGLPRRQQARILYTASLAELVTHTIEPASWIDGGGTGSAIQYNGVLVIRNSQVVHEQVRNFLELLRKTLDEN